MGTDVSRLDLHRLRVGRGIIGSIVTREGIGCRLGLIRGQSPASVPIISDTARRSADSQISTRSLGIGTRQSTTGRISI